MLAYAGRVEDELLLPVPRRQYLLTLPKLPREKPVLTLLLPKTLAKSRLPTTTSLISFVRFPARAGWVVLGHQFGLKTIGNLGIMALQIQNRTKERQKWRLQITGGYVKRTAAGFFGLLMEQGAASAESKFLSIIPLHVWKICGGFNGKLGSY